MLQLDVALVQRWVNVFQYEHMTLQLAVSFQAGIQFEQLGSNVFLPYSYSACLAETLNILCGNIWKSLHSHMYYKRQATIQQASPSQRPD